MNKQELSTEEKRLYLADITSGIGAILGFGLYIFPLILEEKILPEEEASKQLFIMKKAVFESKLADLNKKDSDEIDKLYAESTKGKSE